MRKTRAGTRQDELEEDFEKTQEPKKTAKNTDNKRMYAKSFHPLTPRASRYTTQRIKRVHTEKKKKILVSTTHPFTTKLSESDKVSNTQTAAKSTQKLIPNEASKSRHFTRYAVLTVFQVVLQGSLRVILC
jgi:precorrin-6x reductase